MALLELRIKGLRADSADSTEQESREDGNRRSPRPKGAKALLSGVKGAALAVVATVVVVPMVSPPVSNSASEAPLQCTGKVRTAFDLIGTIYQLPDNTTQLPDFSTLAARRTVHLQRAELPAEVDGMNTYGIVYRGSFWISWPGNYLFTLASDDGSKLFIDRRPVINDDYAHPANPVQQGVHLNPGRHGLRLEYFECCGDGASVALEMCAAKSK